MTSDNTSSLSPGTRSIRPWPIALFVGLLLVGAIYRYSIAEQDVKMLQIHGSTMGTLYTVKVIVPLASALTQQKLYKKVDSRLRYVNNEMSPYYEGGALFRVNNAPEGVATPVPTELFEVLTTARNISRMTDGAFDITVGPLVKLWGFFHKKGVSAAPSEEDVQQVLGQIGYQYVELKNNTVLKHRPKMQINLSAIAKGKGVDLISEVLDHQGIDHYMIEVGGEVKCKGSKNGRPWRIGIEKPLRAGAREIVHAVELQDAAMATSGDYRSFYLLDGKPMSHTIDPGTGHPVEHNLASVTVIAEDCMRADAYATAFMVLGKKLGLAFADAHSVAAFFISRNADNSLEYAHSKSFEAHLNQD